MRARAIGEADTPDAFAYAPGGAYGEGARLFARYHRANTPLGWHAVMSYF